MGETVSRQRAVGEASRARTRQRVLEAAIAEFTEHGYAAATVSKIAARADVSVQTLYLSWGSKRALLRGHLESTLGPEGGPAGTGPHRLAGRTPRQVTDGIAAAVAAVAARSAVAWRLYRDAAAVDPEIAADWDEFQRLRHETFAAFVGDLPPEALREGLAPSAAADTAWAIASPEAYALLVGRAGYTLAQFEQWMAQTLAASLLR